MIGWPLRLLGAVTLRGLRALGAVGLVFVRTVRHLPTLDRRELGRALSHFGFGSMPLALGVAVLTGGTVVLQAGVYAERFGARQYAGWAGGYAVLWEFGPLLLGLLLAARIGARNAAELALLQVGGTLEGLRGIALDPFRLLIAPRVVGTLISVTALAATVFLVAYTVEVVAAYFLLGLPWRVMHESFRDMLTWRDLAGGVIKTCAFGLAIAIVSTTCGLRARGGARGVGRAAAASVMAGAFSIFLLDFALTGPLARWLA